MDKKTGQFLKKAVSLWCMFVLLVFRWLIASGRHVLPAIRATVAFGMRALRILEGSEATLCCHVL